MTDRFADADFEVIEYCGWLSCRKPIIQTAGRGRRREYCSEACRRAADRDFKRARALVEASERNLRSFRHEVAAYGRKPEDGGITTPEEASRRQGAALTALSRAQAILEFSSDAANDRYFVELRLLVEAITPVLASSVGRASA